MILQKRIVERISLLIENSRIPSKKVELNDPYAFEKSFFLEFDPNNEYFKIYLHKDSLIQTGKWVAYHQGVVLVTGETYRDVMMLKKDQVKKNESRKLPIGTYHCRVDFEDEEKPILPQGKRYMHE